MPVNNYSAYLKSLHPGEAGVIALAKQMNGIAALDDLDARNVSGVNPFSTGCTG